MLLPNRPELFQFCGNYDPSLSDHALINGILKEKVNLNKPKINHFRTYKNFQHEEFKKHFAIALWHVGEIFDEIDDQVYFWNVLMNDILDEVAPVKKIKTRDKDVPYMTIRAKRKATIKYLKNKQRRIGK